MKRYLTALALCTLMTACYEPTPDPVTLDDGTPRLSVRGEDIFTFNEMNCQLGFNGRKAEFRMHTDNMSEYFIADLDRIPSSIGERVTAESLWWTTQSDVELKTNVALDVLKIEDGTIWLWDSREQISAVVRILE